MDEDIKGVMQTVIKELVVEPTKESIQDDMHTTVRSSRKVKKPDTESHSEPKKKIRGSLNIIK